jgi:hypothetical protein
MEIRQSTVKKLSEGDIILTGSRSMTFALWEDNGVLAAEARLYGCSSRLKIVKQYEPSVKTHHSKKYDILKCTFGSLYAKVVEHHGILDISDQDITQTILWLGRKKIAEGRIVYAEKQIAIEITKVKR